MIRVWLSLLLAGGVYTAAAHAASDYLTLLTIKVVLMPFVLEYGMAVFASAYGRRCAVSLVMPRCILYGLCLVIVALTTSAVVVAPEVNVLLAIGLPVFAAGFTGLIWVLVRTAAKSGAVGVASR